MQKIKSLERKLEMNVLTKEDWVTLRLNRRN